MSEYKAEGYFLDLMKSLQAFLDFFPHTKPTRVGKTLSFSKNNLEVFFEFLEIWAKRFGRKDCKGWVMEGAKGRVMEGATEWGGRGGVG